MKSSFNKLINGEQPVLIDFFATWCGPCKSLAPIIKQVASELEGDVKVVKIDIDKNQKLAQRYHIQSIPTMMLFKHGKGVWKQTGLLSKTQILKEVKKRM